MPVILDTDHLTILQQHDSRESERLWIRLAALPADDVSTSIVSVQERLQGWLAYLNNSKKATEILFAYAELERLWHFIARMNVLSFTAEAQDRFDRFRKQKLRTRTLDLRIGCLALTTDSIVLTKNLRDFETIPGVRAEDWTL